ncbi:MFS transporter [uncultured Piscinibacter sp.]|uniref:MFS transporter n=1 Tax=uncultured Piscinibacter sp. TaxID=1131835 RepID=UPI002611A524|nr:MFS transporter [uncultured Piscinibacter sp.]
MNAAWRLTLAAAALMALASGGRAATGLFVSPLNGASGLGLAALSLLLALGQLAVGFAQPLVGHWADRFGAARVIVVGAVALAASTALPAWSVLPGAVALSLIASAVASSAVGSNGLLLGEVSRRLGPARSGAAVGLIGAGASVGQMLAGPALQGAIDWRGWPWAMLALAALSLLAWPLALPLRRSPSAAPRAPAQPVADVLRDARFWRVAASFGVCGFHVAFLTVHMPGVIERCGLPASLAGSWIAVAGAANIAGSLLVGAALRRHDAGWLLVALYGVRALGIVMLLLLPPTAELMIAFALVMGASHMATLPPTTQLVARAHGVERLGTLFGVVMLVHQLGSFAGIWLGGVLAEASGSDRPLWSIDIALALLAAALVWPQRARHAFPAAVAHGA